MTLIKSISGIRGTIGGKTADNLTPIDAVKFAAAYGAFIKQRNKGKEKITIVIGRDARISGKMISSLVANTLVGLAIDVIDIGLSTTPTVEVAVPMEQADGGIIITASHNPKQWNALKLLNEQGEFLNGAEGEQILELAENEDFEFSEVDDLGTYTENSSYVEKHIQEVLNLELVDVEAIKKANFTVVVDAVNSTGGIFIPALLKELNVTCIELYCTPNGQFPHNPEPLKEHLGDLCDAVVENKADFGIALDPDVDRLVFVDEKGKLFGEEYTLVACADFILSKTPGAIVSNLSSTRALADLTKSYGGNYSASAVGEVNVVAEMKAVQAVIGGEGNGGVIYPELHYGRDALVGVALFLSLLVDRNQTAAQIRATYPSYFMSKNKITLKKEMDIDKILRKIEIKYSENRISAIDGLKIDFSDEWVHLRKSNTEPIIRVYTEAKTTISANELADRFISEIKELF